MTEPDETVPPSSPEAGEAPEAPEAPERRKVKCEKCGRLTDVEDITTARGKFYCPECVDGTIALDSVLPFREKYDNRAIRWTVLGCGIALLVVVFGSIFILIYTFMNLNTELECKARMQTLYKKLQEYARGTGAYPPGNNDLRPLYEKRFTKGFALYVCPGTKNIVTTVEHLKDDSASPEGPGMSYFYQGGYGFVLEPGDEKRPLLWDQSKANHKGEGVNVIYLDGHHDYVTESVPELRPPAKAAERTP